MLFTENLEAIILNRHQLIRADELIIVSGYVGPGPVNRLQSVPLRKRVVYGMYGLDGIKRPLHGKLVALHNSRDDLNIFYSTFPVHSKFYVWKNRGEIVHALVGSANFSTSGLTTPQKEMLAETTADTFGPLQAYLTWILNNSRSCLEITADPQGGEDTGPGDMCILSLLGRNGEVQDVAGLNWGQNPANHTNPDDAYIKIRIQDIRNFPDLFPPKQRVPTRVDSRGRPYRHNDAVEIIWDDGLSMEGLLEGSQLIDGIWYPKQISSFPSKSELGLYMRMRLGVPPGQPVRRFHLEAYGRTDISVSQISPGIYRFDFSV